MLISTVGVLSLLALAEAHGNHGQTPIIAGPHQGLWYNNRPADGSTQAESVFSGIATFARLPYFPCLASEAERYDIAFLGMSSSFSEDRLTVCAFVLMILFHRRPI